MSDRLSLTNALADANIDRQKAGRIATEIFDAIHDNVATKQDLQNVEPSLKAEIATVKAEMPELELRVESCIDRIVARLRDGDPRWDYLWWDPLSAPQLTTRGVKKGVTGSHCVAFLALLW